MNTIDPTELNNTLIHDYLKLHRAFKENVALLKTLKINESMFCENMAVKCLIRCSDTSSETYTYWWNHFQKMESHILVLSRFSSVWELDVQSSTYTILDCTYSELSKKSGIELYTLYISLYYAHSWFSQIIKSIK